MLHKNDAFWCRQGPRNDIVISTRVRVGRNTNHVPFPDRMDDSFLRYVDSMIDRFRQEYGSGEDTFLMRIDDLDLHEKRLLRERNIITSEMETSSLSRVLIERENDFSILVNDEDHFRIQVLRPGLQLFECYNPADAVDDSLNRVVQYAFSERFGYLCANPSDSGTGLKVSVIMHLPALVMQKKLNSYINEIRDRGYLINGTLGNGGRVIGGLYHICNIQSSGISELEILETADDVINRLIKYEDQARDEFFSNSKKELEDSVWRSYGILKYARRLNYVESIENLSRIRLGVILSIFKGMDLSEINDLMVRIQWSHLQEYFGIRFNSIVTSDEFRAIFLRRELKEELEADV
jgi:protein arginine kinase